MSYKHKYIINMSVYNSDSIDATNYRTRGHSQTFSFIMLEVKLQLRKQCYAAILFILEI